MTSTAMSCSVSDTCSKPFGNCRESWRFIYEVSAATLKQCGYHLGSAIDDNPLAVLSKPTFRWLANTAGALRGYPVKCAFNILETVFRLFNAYFIGNPFISARPCYPYLYPIYGLCWIAFLLLPAVNWFSSKWLHFLSSFFMEPISQFFQWTYFLSSFFKSDCIFWVHFPKMIAFFKFTATMRLPFIQPIFLLLLWDRKSVV